MLPTEDVAVVGELLAKMFGLPFWQAATTATDANRFVIRWCRAITRRPKILVFHGCYHGAVDDTFVRLKDGKPIHRPGLLGQVYDVTQFTKVVEFNDVAALEAALAPGDVACVLTEPALTNIGMVLPQPGFLDALRAVTRKHGTLLVIDETHTISTGYGGYTRTHKLEPDFLTVGKPIAGGIPCSVFGFTAEVEARMRKAEAENPSGYSGMGTTLSANAHGAACDACQSGTGGYAGRVRAHAADVGAAGARRRGEDQGAQSALARVQCRRARRVRVRAGAAEERHRGAGRDASARGTGHPSLSAQSRLHHRAVPQHDFGEPGHHRRPGRSAGRDHRRAAAPNSPPDAFSRGRES